MAGESNDPVSSNEDPGKTGATGSESKETSDEGRTFTEAEYKGLQRSLSKAQTEAADAKRGVDSQKAEVERLRGQAENGTISSEELAAIVTPILTQLKDKDPAAAAALAGQIRNTMTEAKLARANAGDADRKADAEAEAAEVTNMDSLRGVAEAMGVDADDPSIEYGDPSQWLASRITSVRQTSRALADKKSPEKETSPSVSEGTAHVNNPGVIETNRSEKPDLAALNVQYDKLMTEYRTAPHPKKLEKLMEVRDALMDAQGQGELTPPADMIVIDQ